MKKVFAFLLMLAVMVSLCACGGKNNEPESIAAEETETAAVETEAPTEAPTEAQTEAPTPEETEAPTEEVKEIPVIGEYALFATETGGVCAAAEMMGMDAKLTLNDGGTGELSMKSDAGETVEEAVDWELDGSKLSLISEDETVTGTLENGIFTVELTEDIIAYFAAEGADTSAINVLSAEEFAKAITDVVTNMENTGNAISDELGIYSDDTHFVMDMYGVLMSYEHDGDTITGCTGYIDAQSEEAAEYAEEGYVATDPTIESVTHKGSIVIITYNEDAYKTLTLSALEEAFGDAKIEKQ